MKLLKKYIKTIVAADFSNRDNLDKYLDKHPNAKLDNHYLNGLSATEIIKLNRGNDFKRFDKIDVKNLVTATLHPYIDQGIFNVNHIMAMHEFRNEYGRSVDVNETVGVYLSWLKKEAKNDEWIAKVLEETNLIPSKYIKYLVISIKDKY